ncbi:MULTISPECIES: signal peptidase I [unclassified Polaribacter]|uniref:signal peptidase I n=1 Tax=unclassified Polaribacter TaxID=196858 RepID=UPI0011BF54E9|nr:MULTISPECIES: signal peptidase I [unclassified Polaribacter]TXD52042.1 signal peptidase I [Polaribacter sp. IC063]TXD59764.1 signal peptidase I [Polaribacter sp. IC066]
MTYSQWFIFFLVVQVLHFLGTWKLYVKAGRKAWEAAIPIYNGVVLMQIINRPKWWIILLFIPVINLLMFPVIWIETIRTFGYYKKLDSLLVILTLGLYIFYINYATDAAFNADRSLKPRSEVGEWVSSITFAIIAATLVHTYFMQPFTIPTSSLEKSLLVGDYLFVSKFHYGARVPSTVIAAPMVHDSLPFTSLASYLKKPQLPYTRLPGLQNIKNNDIVCFNWPADTLATMWGDYSGKFTYKPVDKKTNYVKRSVGIAGDSLEIRDGYVYINGKKNNLPYRAKLQFYYTYEAKGQIDRNTYPQFLLDKGRTGVYKILTKLWVDERIQEAIKQNGNLSKIGQDSLYTEVVGGVNQAFAQKIKMISVDNKININMTEAEAEKLKKQPLTLSVKKVNHAPDNAIFPHIESNQWSQDNFGPIYIPKAGATVKLDAKSLPYYEQIIKNYENNDLTINGDAIFINGEKADSYTFKQDYYWLVGDNRHNSLDARYWGYVPFDHVLGKPVMIWFSWDANAASLGAKLKSIRWDRMFTTVHGDGEPVSYRYFVFALIALYIGWSFYKARKNKELKK